MNKELFKLNVRWIAHRGLSSHALENTLEAFELAGNLPFYGIECDVHLTYDGYPVVHHDENTLRLTNIDCEIEKTTLNELRNLPVYIPELDEYLVICKKYKKKAIIELKPVLSPNKIEKIVNCVKENNYLEETVFISFSVDNIISLRKLNNDIRLQFLSGRIDDLALFVSKKYNCDLNVHYKNITDMEIKSLKEAQIKINVWTVNDYSSAKQLIDLGVDYITTNGIEV